MMRWVRFAASMINGTPILLIMPVVMFCLWAGVAEIYAVSVWAHFGGDFAVLGLVGVNVLYSWLLLFGYFSLAHDLRDLRLPKHRQVLVGALAIVLGLIFVAPCTFVLSVHGSEHDFLMVAMGSVAGTAGALLWRLRSGVRDASRSRISAAGIVPSVAAQLPNPWRAVRVALGPPYAPASWQRRVIELASLCAVVAAAPLLVLLFESSLRPRTFNVLLRAAEIVGFLTAIGLCWIWPLSRLVAIFNPQSGALPELALLPGLGGGRQQLRRISVVALSAPAGGLVVLLIIALSQVALEHVPNAIYARVVLEFLLIPLITAPILLGQIVTPRATSTWSGTALMFSQTWTLGFLVWSTWNVPDTAMVRVWTVALALLFAVFVVGMSVHPLRKLLQRPHPFVEMSS
jgi:hypothetical protein